MRMKDLLTQGVDFSHLPPDLVIDISGFSAKRLKEYRLLTYSSLSLRKGVTIEDVQVRVLLIPGLEVLSPDQIIWIMINGRSIGPIKPSLKIIDRKQTVFS